MAGHIVDVQRDTAIALIAEVWGIPESNLSRMSAIELDRILASREVAAKTPEILRRLPQLR